MSGEKNNKEIIDPKSDRQQWMRLNGTALAAAVVLALLGCIYAPVTLIYNTAGMGMLLLRFVLLLICAAAYFFAYEYIRAAAIEKISGEKAVKLPDKPLASAVPNRSLTFKEYLKTSFVPVLLLGAVLLIFMFILPVRFFWQVYIIQIINLAGAAGDVYIAYKLYKLKGAARIEYDGSAVIIKN